MTIRALAFAALAACTASWHVSTIDDVYPGKLDERALVVTDRLAIDLDLVRADDDQLFGQVRAAWRLPAPFDATPAAAELEPGDAPPEVIATDLHWQRVDEPAGTVVAVRRADVRWMRVYEHHLTRTGRIAVYGVLGVAVTLAALYGMAYAIISCCAD
jgi:hypothetical protein